MIRLFGIYRLICTCSLLIFSISFAYGQEEEELDSLLRREIRVENPVYKPVIGIGAGIMNFYGDVRNDYFNPMIGNYAFKVNVSTSIDRKRNFLGNFFLYTGALTANERSFTDTSRNLNFRSDIITFGINMEYNFGHIFKREDPVVKPFLSVGVENLTFSSKGDLLDAEGTPYYYWSDGSIRNISESQKNLLPNRVLYRDWNFETDLREKNLYGLGNYSQNTFAIPLDIGMDFRVGERVKMRLATSFHFTFTDLIDNVSWEGEGITGKKNYDHFTYTYLTMHLDLFSEPKVIVEELLFAELDDFDYTMFEDEDGDGIIDAVDDCPGTPSGVEVDTLGCPYDDDNDGVPDYMDRERNTRPGGIVDENGVTLSEEELINMLASKEAVPRRDLILYLASLQSGERLSLIDMPEKFHSLDNDGDAYLSFDELLKAIDDFFDYRSELITDEVYQVINFFFAQ
ncbi:MAG: hypothetical protein AMS27_11315 [Bacteroides sp. SM23_62_1]|nr:MAG: hypothetical protein AMS27_11315 [Bacteroides sp. SM23_62_1]